MTLPSRMYGNPERILMNDEHWSCKGCTHKQRAWGVNYCDKHDNRAGQKMRRCKDYKGDVA